MRTCVMCGQEKPLADFDSDSGRSSKSKRSQCKDCQFGEPVLSEAVRGLTLADYEIANQELVTYFKSGKPRTAQDIQRYFKDNEVLSLVIPELAKAIELYPDLYGNVEQPKYRDFPQDKKDLLSYLRNGRYVANGQIKTVEAIQADMGNRVSKALVIEYLREEQHRQANPPRVVAHISTKH